MTDDARLLREYAEQRDESAFTELVARHVDLVYSVARRRVAGDTHLAEDVVQTVFLDLSRQAAKLPPALVLPGWLCRHAFFVASTKVRAERRRRAREQEAAQMTTPSGATDTEWERISPLLDEALQGLVSTDRDALVLRYFEGFDLRTVGQALGTSEDNAQKRVSRALEKLRRSLARRGMTLTAGSLAVALAAETARAAPAGLAGHVAAAALTGAGTGSGSLLTWIKLMAWAKAKGTLISTAAVLVAAVTTSIVFQPGPSQIPVATATLRGQAVKVPVAEPAAASNTPGGLAGFHWSQVESTDYRQYIANLRAIGCSEQVVRDIVIADVFQAFAARVRAIYQPPAVTYWRKQRGVTATSEQTKQIKALKQEQMTVLKELLGVSVDAHDVVSLLYLQENPQESEFLFLPPEQQEAARRVLRECGLAARLDSVRLSEHSLDGRELESLLGVTAETLQRETLGEDFSSREDLPTLSLEKRARLRELNLRFRQQTELARAGVPSWDTDNGVDARIRELDQQKDAELAAFLSPQEFNELKFRASPEVLYALARLPEAGSESEFRQMVGVVEEVGLALAKTGPSRWAGLSRRLGLVRSDEAKAEQERAEKEERLNARLKEVLGEARLAELQRAEQARSAANRVKP